MCASEDVAACCTGAEHQCTAATGGQPIAVGVGHHVRHDRRLLGLEATGTGCVFAQTGSKPLYGYAISSANGRSTPLTGPGSESAGWVWPWAQWLSRCDNTLQGKRRS
jgi:hypothetical protein